MKSRTIIFFLASIFLSISYTGCKNSGKLDKADSSASEISAEAKSSPVAQKAESSPELVSQLHQAALDGDLKAVELALESGADVNGMEEEGRTALMFAAFNGHSEIVLTLLEEGAGIDRRDQMGRTSLLYAATGPFPETVKILLDKGAEPNVVDSDEHFSPLMHAAAEGNLDVVKILLEAGSNPALTDVDGDNAASFARQAGHLEVATYLESLPNDSF